METESANPTARSPKAENYVPRQAHRAMAMMSMASGVSASGPTATGVQTTRRPQVDVGNIASDIHPWSSSEIPPCKGTAAEAWS
jgi:hypothetical protein